jgi:hypothetical protein
MMASDQRLAEISREQVKRRGLMAGLAALVAGLLGKATERVAEATHGGGNDPTALHVNQTNTGTTITTLNTNFAGAACLVGNAAGTAIKAAGSQFGLDAEAPGIAVKARSTGSGNAIAASADQTNCIESLSAAGHAVFGLAFGLGPGGTGSGKGVFGKSIDNDGVRAESNTGVAMTAVSPSNFACYGFSPNGVGVRGETQIAAGLAGQFVGAVRVQNIGGTTNTGNLFVANDTTIDRNLNVNGNLVVLGTKSAGLASTDGTVRLVYCVESPESWFQDFGEARMVGDRVEVPLDPGFTAIVHTDSYHVVLTEYGDTYSGLYVSRRGPTSFEVRATYNKDPITFGYMIVARRKDVAAPRLQLVPRERLFPTPPAGPRDPERPAMTPVSPGIVERRR